MSEEEAEQKVGEIKTMPEKIYRRKMSDEHGLLLIYLIDTKTVFRQDEPEQNTILKQMAITEGFDLDIPLVGYALGFPPIQPDPGGVYAQGRYSVEDPVDETEEWIPELEITEEY